MSEYRQIVDKKRDAMLETLLECIENNSEPWQKGWVAVKGGISSGYPYNAATGKSYSGVNALYLALLEGKNGYGDCRWVTFNQAKDLGASVRKGEKGSDVFFWSQYDISTKKLFNERTIEGLSDIEQKEYLDKNVRPILKNYTVFNAAQCDNFPKLDTASSTTEQPSATPGIKNEDVEKIIQNSAAPVRYDGGANAFYSKFSDDIHLPKIEAFTTMNNYYATALHEIAHSTGHETRLNRDLSGRFGSEKYAIEELRAELTSVFMQTDLGIDLGTAEVANHGAYLKSWLSVVKNDHSVFYKAASDATQATKYIRDNYLLQEVAETANEGSTERLFSSDIAPLGSTEVVSAQSVAAAIGDNQNATGVSAVKKTNTGTKRQVRLDNLEKNVPGMMKEMPNWCAFNVFKDEAGEYKKKIWDCNSGGKKWARSNDPSTWTTFDKAIKYARENRCDGISFALTKESGIFCVDLDKCRVNGKYSPLAWGVYNAAKGTYTERSVSGSGLHVFGKKGADVDFSALGNKNADGTLEYYEDGRFMSMTGDLFMRSEKALKTFSASDKLLSATAEQLPVKTQISRSEMTFVNPESDSEVIERIRRSKKADEFNRLYSGEDICHDLSRSDMKLLNILGYFTNCDAEQMKRIFESSGLMRADKSRGYLDRTIEKVIGTIYNKLSNIKPAAVPPKNSGTGLG